MNFTLNDLPDFMNLMAEKINKLEEILAAKQHSIKNINDEPRMDMKETANYLRCSLSTLQTFKNNGVIPYHQAGRHVYFIASEIDAATLVPMNVYSEDKRTTSGVSYIPKGL